MIVNTALGNDGQGGGATIGQIMDGLGFEASGNIDYLVASIGVLNLRQQLIDAKLSPDAKASFGDWEKLVNSTNIPSLNELYKKTISGGYKLNVSENSSLPTPAKAEFEKIQVNMNKIKNLLDYAFTLGHEMTHSFTDLHFRSRFFELYDIRNGQQMRDHTYSFFKEVVGVGWEINLGETRYGGLNDVNAARKYYPQIMKGAKDQIEPYLKLLQREWQKVYNSK
jgi:hypothetical protein